MRTSFMNIHDVYSNGSLAEARGAGTVDAN